MPKVSWVDEKKRKIEMSVDWFWDNVVVHAVPEFADELLEMTGGDVDKAKRISAFLFELIMDTGAIEDGSVAVPIDEVKKYAEKWNVTDVVIEDLIKLLHEKYGCDEVTT